MAQIGEVKIRPRQDFGNTRAVQKVRVALCVRQHRGGFAIRLAKEAVGGAGDQPARRIAVLHQLQQCAQFFRGQGEIFPDGGKCPAVAVLVADAEHDQPAEDGLGLLVPVRFRDLSRRVHDQCLCQGGDILTQIEAVRCQPVERVVGGRGHPGDHASVANTKRIEDMDRSEPPPGFPGDPGILTLGVDDQDRAFRCQQVRDDGADAFPGPCRGEGDQMGGTVIAQQPTRMRIAPDQKAVFPLELLQLLAVGEAGGAVAVAGQPEEGVRARGHAPILEPEDTTDKNERTEDQPLPGAFAGRLVKEGEDERRGDKCPDHRAEQDSADHPAQQDGREDQPTEEPEQSSEDEHHAPHQDGVSGSELDGAGEGAPGSAKALRSCSRGRLRISRSSIAAALESRSARSRSAPPRITLRRVSSLRCLVVSRFFSA